MGVPAFIKINLHDQHAAAVIQYRLVASGLLPNPPPLPDATKENELPTLVQQPKGIQHVKLQKISLRHLWEQSGVMALGEQNRYDYTVHSDNREVAALKLRTDHSPALNEEDRIHASMSWINNSRTLTWENETLNLRFTTDTTHDPYSSDILAMRVDVARALEAIFLKLEEENDPFCDTDDIVLEEGNGLIPVPILEKLLYELDHRQSSNEEKMEEKCDVIIYKVTDELRNATLVDCAV